MCEFNRYKVEILWCTPMNAPFTTCVDNYTELYEKIDKIVEDKKGKES